MRLDRSRTWPLQVILLFRTALSIESCLSNTTVIRKKPVPYAESLRAKEPRLAEQWHPTKNAGVGAKDVYAGTSKKAWWLCGSDHQWEARILNRVNGRGCPDCSKKRTSKDYSLATEFPAIAGEWHPTLNGNLIPELVMPMSGRKAWWLCSQHHEYEAIIGNRTKKGTGCAFCTNKKANVDNNLAVIHPTVAAEWHPKKNGALQPSEFVFGSSRKVWWMCEKDHEWQASITNRTLNGSNCPKCSHQHSSMELRIFAELEYFWTDTVSGFRLESRELDIYLPSLKLGIEFDGAYWHHQRDGQDTAKNKFFKDREISVIRVRQKPLPKIAPQDILVGAKELSKRNLDRFFKAICKLTGTDILESYFEESEFLCETQYKKYLANVVDASPERSLAELHPLLIREWDLVKNKPLVPNQFSVGSDYLAWWECEQGHSWRAAISSRANKKRVGCPYCKGRLPSETNNLAVIHPTVAAEWHPKKNGALNPDEVLSGSKRKVWWRCSKNANHEWQASINNRVGSAGRKSTGCPSCYKEKPYRRKPIPYESSISAKFPALTKEWHPNLNPEITPADLTPGSNKKVFWTCAKRHVWQATVKNRVHGKGCPNCKWNRKGGQRSWVQSQAKEGRV